MWRVRKGQEPHCLADVRREVGRIEAEAGSPLKDRWAEIKDCKDALQRAVRRDQGGLCAYCGGRLPANMKIEHFVPRSVDPNSILEWSNLLGCCSGEYREGERQVLHCDSHRTPLMKLNFHPVTSKVDPRTVFVVNVTGGTKGLKLGEIEAKTDEAEHDRRELNLNASRLVANRRDVIVRLRLELSSYGRDETKVKQFIRQRLATATAAPPGELPPYVHVAIEYLERKRRQRGL
jgi:uncharacterized protein (TIGR02646 family)